MSEFPRRKYSRDEIRILLGEKKVLEVSLNLMEADGQGNPAVHIDGP